MKMIVPFIALILFCSFAGASEIYFQKVQFECSDNKNYDIAIHYISNCFGQNKWSMAYFCSEGQLTKDFYHARIDPHEDLNKCADELSESITFCMKEFVEKNGESGEGDFPKIIQGR